MAASERNTYWLVAVCLATTVWSAIAPYDYATWFFELMLGFVGVLTLFLLRKRYPFAETGG